MELQYKHIKLDACIYLCSMWSKFNLTSLMDLCGEDPLSCFIMHHSANTALIKLSLIKVFLILLAWLIDLICLSSTIGCDLYLVNELIDLALVQVKESKRILTCCPFNLAHSGHSLGHVGSELAKVFVGELGVWVWTVSAMDCHSAWLKVWSTFPQFVSEWRSNLCNDILKAAYFIYSQTWGGKNFLDN